MRLYPQAANPDDSLATNSHTVSASSASGIVQAQTGEEIAGKQQSNRPANTRNNYLLLPMRYTFLSHVGQTPLVAGLPFFMVTC
jgi:hypothetical protein